MNKSYNSVVHSNDRIWVNGGAEDFENARSIAKMEVSKSAPDAIVIEGQEIEGKQVFVVHLIHGSMDAFHTELTRTLKKWTLAPAA